MIIEVIEFSQQRKWEQYAKEPNEKGIDGSVLPGIGEILDPLAFALMAGKLPQHAMHIEKPEMLQQPFRIEILQGKALQAQQLSCLVIF